MPYTVIVSFGPNNEYEYKLSDGDVQALPRKDADGWLYGEYETLDCMPRNPVGKILLLDVILDVAKYGGEKRFAGGSEWAQQFARCCAAALQRNTIRIDVPNLVVA